MFDPWWHKYRQFIESHRSFYNHIATQLFSELTLNFKPALSRSESIGQICQQTTKRVGFLPGAYKLGGSFPWMVKKDSWLKKGVKPNWVIYGVRSDDLRGPGLATTPRRTRNQCHNLTIHMYCVKWRRISSWRECSQLYIGYVQYFLTANSAWWVLLPSP